MNDKWNYHESWNGSNFIAMWNLFQRTVPGIANQIGQEFDGHKLFFGSIMIPRKTIFRIVGGKDE